MVSGSGYQTQTTVVKLCFGFVSNAFPTKRRSVGVSQPSERPRDDLECGVTCFVYIILTSKFPTAYHNSPASASSAAKDDRLFVEPRRLVPPFKDVRDSQAPRPIVQLPKIWKFGRVNLLGLRMLYSGHPNNHFACPLLKQIELSQAHVQWLSCFNHISSPGRRHR